MATLLIEQQALAKLSHVFLVRHFALFAMIEDQVPGLLSMGCQRRLLSGRLAKGFMYKLRGQILNYMPDHFSGLVLIH